MKFRDMRTVVTWKEVFFDNQRVGLSKLCKISNVAQK